MSERGRVVFVGNDIKEKCKVVRSFGHRACRVEISGDRNNTILWD